MGREGCVKRELCCICVVDRLGGTAMRVVQPCELVAGGLRSEVVLR